MIMTSLSLSFFPTRYARLTLSSRCVCVCTTPVCVFASQSRAPQGRLESPEIKSGLYTKFQDQAFLQTLERACEAQICKGFVRLGCVKLCTVYTVGGVYV